LQTVSLNGDWKLYYHPEEGTLPASPAELMEAQWPVIDAQVPGNVELDLMRAGLAEDPFYAENLYDFRKYEFYQWWFVRTFEVPADYQGRKCVLQFDGIDTFADVFVNGIPVGSTDNMFIEHVLDVTGALNCDGENQIAVRIRSTMNEARNLDYPACCNANESADEYTQIRKAASMFGWDIMPRLMSAGI
jgi:beta-mannosidase